MTDQAQKQDIKYVQPWLHDLKSGYDKNITSTPNYFVHDTASSLITTSNLHSLHLGTGDSIYESLEPLLLSANHEIILVTCFWAASTTQQRLNAILLKLSNKGLAQGRKIRIRINFSSSSIWQKLFHPQTIKGKVYDPSSWPSLHLPHASELQGLDLQVKSIFLLPFSVMHPKFIVVDRKTAVLPSCNVSWEEWFEGAVTLTGPVVHSFIQFWRKFWVDNEDREAELFDLGDSETETQPLPTKTYPNQQISLPLHTPLETNNIQTLFLPSPHHRNPQFRFPWQASAPVPPTPLNTFLLRALSAAEKEIYIQTPNLTAAPVLSAILRTLQRGIDIHILTSETLMVLEQLVTAGTTTSRCIASLQRRYRALVSTLGDLETGVPRPGILKIDFFAPRQGDGEPRQSHLKCMVVDRELVVLGSGNLDRASWFTSQELGVAFFDRGFAEEVLGKLEGALKGRVRGVC